MGRSFHYKAFLSYSHKDRVWGQWLLKALESYRVPKHLVGKKTSKGIIPKRLIPIFRDRDELPAADNLSDEIRDALANSEYLIVLCSPDGAKSLWVNKEIEEFKRQRGHRNILCVIVGGEPGIGLSEAGSTKADCFPPALIGKTSKSAEPIAADLRKNGDGKRLALLKLVAGMIGVRLDEIIRRDLQRRNKRVTAITLATVVIMITMGSLTFAAIKAEREAEQRRVDAEGLIEFMLTDLRNKLEPVGRLDVLDAVGEKAIGYYAAQQLQDLSENSLGRRARAFHLLGEIEDLQGDLQGAQVMFEAAAEATEDMLKRNPHDQQRIFDHSQSIYWVGFMKWQRGDFHNALADFQTYKDLATQLVVLDPNNLDWQMEVTYANSNLGTLYLVNLDQPEKALETFKELLVLRKQIFNADTEDSKKSLDLANTYGWLADAAKIAGTLGEAENYRREQIALLEKVLDASPNNVYATGELNASQLGLARIEMAQGEGLYAVSRLQSLVRTSENLIEHDPSNANWLKQAARHYLYLADAYLLTDSLDDANKALIRGRELIENYESMTEIYFREKVQLTYFYQLLRAKISFLYSDTEATHNICLEIIKSMMKELIQGSKASSAYQVLSEVYVLAGLAAVKNGDALKAKDEWELLVDLVEPRIDIEPPETLNALMNAYLLLEEQEKAEELHALLNQKGYAKHDIYAINTGVH